MVSEEDKSSVLGNPLTDRSTNLWKTFYNWAILVQESNIDTETTCFILYANNHGKPALVNRLNSAKDTDDARQVISEIKKGFSDINNEHNIWKYYSYLLNNENLFIEIIKKFSLIIGDGAGLDEVRDELKRILVPETQIPFLVQNLTGWLHNTLTEMIAENQIACITWDDFYKEKSVLFDRVRQRELIDFTLIDPIDDKMKKMQLKLRPSYIKQLELIDCTEEEIVESVTAFLKAKVNRQKWIENEIIDEDSAVDFQNKLSEFWVHSKKRIFLTQQDKPEEVRGQLLLLDCSTHQATIRNMPPPSSTIAGTYHTLADNELLGWHPRWQNLIQKA